jgi:hypothetical protein
MNQCLLIAAVLAAIQAAIAFAVWRFAVKPQQRPLKVRLLSAFFGALAAAIVARPLVEAVILSLGYIQEAAGMISLFTFYSFLPLTVGISGWLFSEVYGGRSAKPWRGLIFGIAGGFLGSVLVIGALLGAKLDLPAAVGFALLFGIPSALSTAGIWRAAR